MCVVSVVTQYGHDKIWPEPQQPFQWQLLVPPQTGIPPALTEEIQKIRQYLELIAKAKEADRITGQPDCEEPDKIQWIKDMEARLARLEETVNKLAGRP